MKKITLLTFLLLLLLTSCWSDIEEKNEIYYWTWIVFSWSINIDNTYVWYIQWDKMVNLAPKVWGRITDIYVKQWDVVKKGDLLLKLDSNEAKVWYTAARSIVDTLISMKNDTRNMFDQQIKSMNSKVEQVKLWKQWLSDGLLDTVEITNAQLETAKTAEETAKANLDHMKNVLDTKELHIYDNSKDAIVSSVILDINIINFIDALLWRTTKYEDENDSFEDYLWVKNAQKLKDTESLFDETLLEFNDYKKFYDDYIDWKKPEVKDIIDWLQKWEKLAEKLKTLLSYTYDVLDDSIANIELTQATINNYKNQISTFWNNVEASLITVSWEYFLWLKWSRQSISDFNNAYEMQMDLLNKQYELAKNTHIQYIAMSKWKVNEVKTKSNVSKMQLDEILAWLESLKKQKNSKLREIDAKINEAKWSQNSAWVMINNWKIISPVDWIITKKMSEVWQVVWWGMPLLSISNTDKLVVNINIWEKQSRNISIWTEVLLEIEWINNQITWYISNINLSKDMITKKVWVEVSLNNELENINIWSFVKVVFNNKTENNILISNNAIISQFMIPWVYVIDDNKVIFKNIKIVKQNDSFSEIKGLNIWEIIITDWKENLYDWEKLK